MSIGTMAIELRVFKKKKINMDKNGKTFSGIILLFTFGAEIFGILFSFHMLSAIKNLIT